MLFVHMFYVGIGAAIGAIMRYMISLVIKPYRYIPISTFVVNLLGSLCIGALSTLHLSSALQLLLMTGFCGGLTTFSTFNNEVFTLIKNKHYVQGILYMGSTYLLGFLALFIGIYCL